MADGIKHADALSDGLLIILKDGREALLKPEEVIDCAEKTDAFERAELLRREAEVEDNLSV